MLGAFTDACRFEREILGGRLWHPSCQAGNADLPEALPDSFECVGALLHADWLWNIHVKIRWQYLGFRTQAAV